VRAAGLGHLFSRKDPAELAPLLRNREGVIVEPDSARALDRALALAGEILVVCGSIYLVGEVRARVA
jgi:folylpolyglutamate synthase/dihydropteroate synthase